jgi:hypothetical protein
MTRRLLMLLALAAALVVGGCGSKEDTRTFAATEGPYLDVGDLKYQVQISRLLNPADIDDANNLRNLPAGTLPPKADEAWFGVWIRVENTDSEKPLPTATQFQIRDTQGNVYKPYAQVGNAFAYTPIERLKQGEVLPDPNGPAGFSPIQGSLVLFKLTYETLQNRPLVFRITSPTDPTDIGAVNLDV